MRLLECIKMKYLRGVDHGAYNNCDECDDFTGKLKCDS